MASVDTKVIKTSLAGQSNWLYIGGGIATVVVAVFLLFFRLGDYPLFLC